MSTEETLPEDIRGKIDKWLDTGSNCFLSGETIAAYGYHLRDSEVDKLQSDVVYWHLEANAKAATIKELLDGLEKSMQIIKEQEGNFKYRDAFMQQMGFKQIRDFKQLLNKHKP